MTLLKPASSSTRPKVNRWTDWTPSAPTMDIRHPASAAIQPRRRLLPEMEPQISRPNTQNRKVSQSPNFRAILVTKG